MDSVFIKGLSFEQKLSPFEKDSDTKRTLVWLKNAIDTADLRSYSAFPNGILHEKPSNNRSTHASLNYYPLQRTFMAIYCTQTPLHCDRIARNASISMQMET